MSPAMRPTIVPIACSISRIFVLIAAISTVACASAPKPQGFQLPPALSEVYRNGQLKGMETATTPELGIPNDTDLVSHSCSSVPQFNLYGQYVTTIVRCW